MNVLLGRFHLRKALWMHLIKSPVRELTPKVADRATPTSFFSTSTAQGDGTPGRSTLPGAHRYSVFVVGVAFAIPSVRIDLRIVLFRFHRGTFASFRHMPGGNVVQVEEKLPFCHGGELVQKKLQAVWRPPLSNTNLARRREGRVILMLGKPDTRREWRCLR